MNDVVSNFEDVVSLFKSLLVEDRIKSLITPPATDLVHSLRQTEVDDDIVALENWPDVALIFGKDPDYQDTVKSLITLVKKEIRRVRIFSEVHMPCHGR